MNPMKLRRTLISIHLYLAAFLTPAFLLVAVTGGLQLAGVRHDVTTTQIELPADFVLDANSPDAVQNIQNLADSLDLDVNVEYLRARGPMVQTRPTTGPHIQFANQGGKVTAEYNEPSFMYAMMELHKGHGPQIFRMYGAAAGLALFFVVIGGFAVGVLAPNYRNITLVGTGIGIVGFLLFGFVL